MHVLVDERTAAAYVLVHTGGGDRQKLDLGERYSFAWNGDRLDIYTGKKTSTFIYFGREEDHDEPVMSVALDRFGSSFQRAHNVRLRKEKLVAVELFCLYPRSETPHVIHRTRPGKDTEKTTKSDIQSLGEQPEFRRKEKDFPHLGCGPEELLSDLEWQYREINRLIREKELAQIHLEQLYDEMIRTRFEDEQVNRRLIYVTYLILTSCFPHRFVM